MGEVIEGVHILQQAGFLQVAHPGGGAAGVQPMAEGVGAGIEGVVVLALVDAHAPEHDAGVVAVLADHLLHVPHRLVLPGFSPDMLPAGDLRKHQQTQPVALVDEIGALGIVGGAHGGAAQLLLQDAGVLPLELLRRGVADAGIALVPVQAPEIAPLPVEEEAVRPKLHRAEAEQGLPGVQHPSRFIQQLRPAGVAPGVRRGPGLHAGDAQAKAVPSLLGRQAVLPVPDRKAQVVGSAAQLQPGLQQIQLRGVDEQILDIRPAADIQPGLPIETAIGQIVDHKAEGRDLPVLRAVQPDRYGVLPLQVHQIRDLRPKGRVAAAVLGADLPVHIDGGNVSRAVKLQEQPLLLAARGELQCSPVAADRLVVLRPGIMLRDLPHVVGQADGLALPFSAQKLLRPPLGIFPAAA